MFASVAMLLSFAHNFKKELLADFILTPQKKHVLEKFLCLEIRKPKLQIRSTYHCRNKGTKYYQRLQDTRGFIHPAWEIFINPNDEIRDRSAQEIAVRNLENKNLHLLDDNQSISNENPDPQALTAVLNLIAKINPKLCEPTPVSGNFYTGKSSRSRVSKKF